MNYIFVMSGIAKISEKINQKKTTTKIKAKKFCLILIRRHRLQLLMIFTDCMHLGNLIRYLMCTLMTQFFALSIAKLDIFLLE